IDYGTRSEGVTDDSQAFLKAWNAACSSAVEHPRVIIPQKTFFVNPIKFRGPCKATKITFTILGTIIAPNWPIAWDGLDSSQWLAFDNVNGLNVDGFGTIDGQGKGWWDQSCRYHSQLEQCTTLAPTALKFLSCNGSSLSNTNFINSPQTHVLIKGCNEFEVNNVVIESPRNSPNTDGIHIHSSHNLQITNSKIGSGDDCISIGDYVSNVEISNIMCGPGHGISIGSLGRGGTYVKVEKIHISNAQFEGTTNGARIKTWQIGKGYVRNVTFENLIFMSVKNPIIIDQNYCVPRGSCKQRETGVRISDVTYKNMYGTSSTKIAINLNCSQSVPCSGIFMQSIQLESAHAGKQVAANCNSAFGEEENVFPGPCLSKSKPLIN
ncbi:probable polygalacturonase At1g80170, partial [Olea europaea var. sylvestris]|uniref:probable polygalacturonase At1g80170 n=1 Tax=Olea europaea var. sylvestris TaxID=158386 RepID=UPI000C1D7F43